MKRTALLLFVGIFMFPSFVAAAPLTCGDGICSLNETIDSCYADCKPGELLPTNVFGRISDEDGNPVPGEIITALWVDEFGKNRSTLAETLSQQEARELGNSQLVGYFFFNDGSIRAKPGSTIELRTQPRYTFTTTPAQPGRTKDIGDLTVFGIIPRSKISNDVEGFAIGESLSYWFSRMVAFIRENVINLFLLWVFAIAIYFFYREFRRRKRIRSVTDFGLYRAVKNISPRVLEDIMMKKVTFVGKYDPLLDVLHKMSKENANMLIVMEGSHVVGCIREKDLLKNAYAKRDFDSVKALDIMESHVFIQRSDAKILDVGKKMLAANESDCIILKNTKIVGHVSMKGISQGIHDCFPSQIDESVLPIINDVYESNIIRHEKTTNLQTIITNMKKHNADYCIVYEKVNSKSVRNVGIITNSDLVSEFKKNPNSLKKLVAATVMKSPIISIKPHNSVLRANSKMIEKSIRHLPVISYEKIVGMLDQDKVLESLINFLNITKEKIESSKKLIK